MIDVGLLVKAVTEEGLLTQIYGDLAKPGVSQVGKALSTVLGLGNTILWPIQMLNERARIALEVNLEQFREKMTKVPEEKVVAVGPEIGVPILEKLSYILDSDLRELYTNLLVSASNVDTQSQAHPSFVNILNNISPDEAMLIRQFRQQGGGIPFVTGKLINDQGHFLPWEDIYFELWPDTKISFQNNLPAYMSNLEGLGLIDIQHGTVMLPMEIYEPLERLLKEKPGNNTQIANFKNFSCDRGKIAVTRFGFMFIGVCVS